MLKSNKTKIYSLFAAVFVFLNLAVFSVPVKVMAADTSSLVLSVTKQTLLIGQRQYFQITSAPKKQDGYIVLFKDGEDALKTISFTTDSKGNAAGHYDFVNDNDNGQWWGKVRLLIKNDLNYYSGAYWTVNKPAPVLKASSFQIMPGATISFSASNMPPNKTGTLNYSFEGSSGSNAIASDSEGNITKPFIDSFDKPGSWSAYIEIGGYTSNTVNWSVLAIGNGGKSCAEVNNSCGFTAVCNINTGKCEDLAANDASCSNDSFCTSNYCSPESKKCAPGVAGSLCPGTDQITCGEGLVCNFDINLGEGRCAVPTAPIDPTTIDQSKNQNDNSVSPEPPPTPFEPGKVGDPRCNGDMRLAYKNGVCLPADKDQECVANPGSLACAGGLTEILVKVIKWLLGIVGAVAVLILILGGFWYMTSAGNEEQVEKGKKAIINAIIGLVVIIMSYAIVTIVNNTLIK